MDIPSVKTGQLYIIYLFAVQLARRQYDCLLVCNPPSLVFAGTANCHTSRSQQWLSPGALRLLFLLCLLLRRDCLLSRAFYCHLLAHPPQRHMGGGGQERLSEAEEYTLKP